MQDRTKEITFNFWFLIDEAVGFAYALMGRAYLLTGSDDEKLKVLHALAPTDYLLATKYRVPENFSVIDPAGNVRKRLVDPGLVMVQANVAIICEEVIRELEKIFPPKITWEDGEMRSEPMLAPQAPLMVCTGLLEHEDGQITSLIKPFP